jgi:hypothetical protein
MTARWARRPAVRHFFRAIGGTVSVAVFGAIFINRLSANLAETLLAGAAAQLWAPPRRGPGVALPPVIRSAFSAQRLRVREPFSRPGDGDR